MWTRLEMAGEVDCLTFADMRMHFCCLLSSSAQWGIDHKGKCAIKDTYDSSVSNYFLV